MIRFTDPREENVVADVLSVLDRWYIAASGDECLWLQPRKSALDLREFCTLLKRIHRVFSDHRFKVLVFYFDGVETPRSLWLIILRLLTAFAKIMQKDCRIIRSVKVTEPTSAGCERMESSSRSKEPGRQSRQMMRLNGITIIIEPRATDVRRLGVGRNLA